MFSDGLYSLLSSAAAVTTLVGTSNSRTDKTTGIFSGEMPEETPMPAAVFRQISGETLMCLDGPDGRQSIRMQISCYGKSYLDSKKLARAVRQTLERYTGLLADGTQVGNMQTVLESDTFEEAPFLYHTPVDFEISYFDPTF